jgi:hypothetical protein
VENPAVLHGHTLNFLAVWRVSIEPLTRIIISLLEDHHKAKFRKRDNWRLAFTSSPRVSVTRQTSLSCTYTSTVNDSFRERETPLATNIPSLEASSKHAYVLFLAFTSYPVRALYFITIDNKPGLISAPILRLVDC